MSKLNLDIPTTKLPNGGQMPVLGYGLGTANSSKRSAGGLFSSVDKELVAVVQLAMSLGYYHLDGAESYGNEKELGAAIKASKIPREKLFVTTKLDPEPSIDKLSEAFDQSLKNLGLEYVDLYLIHHPFWAEDDEKKLQEKWAEMEEIQRSGRAKAIGVSNYIQPQIEAILKTATIPPAVNQIEYHPYLQHEGLVDFLKSKNIQATGYAPQTPITRAAGKSPEMDAYLDELAKKYAVDPGEILLRWCLDQDVIPITTSTKETRLSDYLRSITFKLTPKEFEQISEIGKKTKFRGFWKKKIAEDDWR